MKCRHPLETGLKLDDIINPNNERYNRNILKKICISDAEFEHLCESPSTSSNYRNLFLTPLQKAMTYCMIHDGGSSTDEAILAFILRFWKTISAYNNSDNPGSTNQKYRRPPTKRILHINYTILRDGLPLFVCHGDDKWGTNTIDGVKVKNSNSRTPSKESISKIKSFNHLIKDEKNKGDETTLKRGERRSGQSPSSSGSISKSELNSTKSDIEISKSANSDLSRKSSTKISNSTEKSGNDDSKSTQIRSQKPNQNALEGSSSDNDDDESNLNDLDQNNSESDSNTSENLEKGIKRSRRSNTSDTTNAKLSRKSSNFSTSTPSNPNSNFSSFASLNSSKGRQGRFIKKSYLLPNKSTPNIPEGETFQKLLLNAMKNDVRNSNGGMTVSEIAQECQSFKYVRGAYYELPLERRVRSVLFMKKQLKEVEYIENSGTWVALSDEEIKSKKDFHKRLQKAINKTNDNNEPVQNDSESEKDEKNIYLPESLRILNMKELTIYDLWNIVNDVGLY